MIELEDTIELMCSDNWRKRLVGEYAQATIRYEKLMKYIKSKGGLTLEDEDLLKQSYAMRDYQFYLFNRIDKSIEDNLACRDIFHNIEKWIYSGTPLTIFDDVDPIKIEFASGEPQVKHHWDDQGVWVSQGRSDGSDWRIISPTYPNFKEAIAEWNKQVRKMNGNG